MVQSLLEEFGGGGKEAEALGSSVVENKDAEIHLMGPTEAVCFRRGAAKLNYIAQDRGDIAYPSKEVSKKMAKPAVEDMIMLIRVVEYLRRYPRWAATYAWQSPPGSLFIQTAIGAAVLAPAGAHLAGWRCTAGIAFSAGRALNSWSR